MDEKEKRSAFLSALTTEHFVLQTAASATVSESAARASIYILSLSSTLVAMGFASQSREAFAPFIASVLPAVFVLGLFTVVRLVDVTLEHQRYLTGIAHIRGYYRTLTPEAAEYFSPERGRWPEAPASPALQLGPTLGLLTTTATMVACINNIVAGVGVTLLVRWLLGPHRTLFAVSIGVVTGAILVGVFYAYQRWRFGLAQRTAPPPDPTPARP